MIVLLSCSINSLASNYGVISSTGGVKQDSLTNDSVLISYSDLRKVNSKLIELDYERKISDNLRAIITNDSIAIDNLNRAISNINLDCERTVKNVKRERNTARGISIGAIILLIISIL